MTEHQTNLAPCHLADLDLSIHPEMARPPMDLGCEICEVHDVVGATIILCSLCSTGWHWACLRQRYKFAGSPPPTSCLWYCPYCREAQRVPANASPSGVGGRLPLRPSSALARQAVVATFVPLNPSAAAQPAPPPLVPTDFRTPDAWRLQSAAQLQFLLQSAMPGIWDKRHLSELSNRLPSGQPSCSEQEFAATLPEEYDALLSAINWSRVSSIWDPWAGVGSTRHALGAVTRVCSTDVTHRQAYSGHNDVYGRAPLHGLANALEPSDTTSVLSTFGPFTGIVSSPWFAYLDLAVASAMSFGFAFVAFHVPGHYVVSATGPRAAFMQRMSEEGRLFISANLPRGVLGRRCAWLVVFASQAARDRLLRPHILTLARSIMLFDPAAATDGSEPMPRRSPTARGQPPHRARGGNK
jgi:hypothetical protein